MPFDEPEDTQLIDVAAVSDLAPDEASATATPGRGTTADLIPVPARFDSDAAVTPTPALAPPAGEARLATVAERCAALWIDAVCLRFAYFGSVAAYHGLFHQRWFGPIPVTGWRGLGLHLLFAVGALLYFIVFEGIFFATPGKACCRLVIRRADGRDAPYLAIIVRNLLRPLDFLPFGLIGLCAMESSRRRQRVGDLVAGTIVVKIPARRSRAAAPIVLSAVASTGGRLAAGAVDLAIAGAFAGGWSLLWNPDAPIRSHWLLIGWPVAVVGFIALIVAATATSPGKWLFGYAVAQENGARVGLSHALLRTIFLPLDLLGFGPVCIALAPRRQRIGDAVAGTVVVRRPRHWPGAIGLATALLCAGGVGYAGWHNPASWRRAPEWRWTFLPRLDAFPNWPAPSAPPEPLGMAHLRFAAGQTKLLRPSAVFLPGETLYLLFEVHGHKRVDRRVWLQEDLALRYPDGSFSLREENIVNYKDVIRSEGPIELVNNITIPLTAMPGKYTAFLTVRDRLADGQTVTQTEFEVKGDFPPLEPGAAPPAPGQETLEGPPMKLTVPTPTTPATPPAELASPPAPAPTPPPALPPPPSDELPKVMPAPPLP